MEEIGEKIRKLRKAKNMSADTLAWKIGKQNENRRQFIYDIETGKVQRIDIGTLKKISQVLNVSLDHFLVATPEDAINYNKERTLESDWHAKYLESLEENSRLKSTIIELMKKLTNT